MANERTREKLAEIFRHRARPDADDFKDLFESFINKIDDQVRVGENKNVGIGVTGAAEPEAKLHVQGDLKLQHGVSVNYISNNQALTLEEDYGVASDRTIPTQLAVKQYFDRNFLGQDDVTNIFDQIFIGSINSFAHIPNEKDGWLPCDGSTYPSESYPLLAERIGNEGDTFNVPDLRGMFIRGYNNINKDGNRADIDQDRDYASETDNNLLGRDQNDACREHTHDLKYGELPKKCTTETESHSHQHQLAQPYHDVQGATAWTDDNLRCGAPGSGGDYGVNVSAIRKELWNPGPQQPYEDKSIVTIETADKPNEKYDHSHEIIIDTSVEKQTDANPSAHETRPKNIALIFCIYAGKKQEI